MASSSPSNGADQPGTTTVRSVPSYEGRVYDGSSSSDEDVAIARLSDTAALLREIAEPDENEEPYDILADNGEFLYEEEDQREYRSINTSAPPLPAMDLLASDSVGSPSITSISEIGEDDSEDEKDSISGNLNRTPKRSNRRSVFRPNSTSAPRPPSPPISMYQMPMDYTFDSSSFVSQELTSGNDSETNSTASSSIFTRSMKAIVKDIDGVLDEMNFQSNTPGGSAKDDDSIPSDVSVGGTTLLSGELERAQIVFYEFTGIDATGTQKTKKLKKKRSNTEQKALLGSKPSTSKSNQLKPSTMSFILFGFSVALIGVFIAVFVFLRKRNSTGIGTEASAVISTDFRISMEPTLSPGTEQDDLILLKPDSSKTRGPTLVPTADPQLGTASSVPSSRPSLRPSEGLKLPITLVPSSEENETSSPSLEPTQQLLSPALLPTSDESGTPDATFVGTVDTPVGSDGGGGDSFPVPDSFIRPWDDNDVVEGEDDFYSNDDDYEYELHHPGHKTTKQGRHHGKQKIEKASKHPKQPKHGRILEASAMQQAPTTVRRIRGRQILLPGFF